MLSVYRLASKERLAQVSPSMEESIPQQHSFEQSPQTIDCGMEEEEEEEEEVVVVVMEEKVQEAEDEGNELEDKAEEENNKLVVGEDSALLISVDTNKSDTTHNPSNHQAKAMTSPQQSERRTDTHETQKVPSSTHCATSPAQSMGTTYVPPLLFLLAALVVVAAIIGNSKGDGD